jgi:hypothetical protein
LRYRRGEQLFFRAPATACASFSLIPYINTINQKAVNAVEAYLDAAFRHFRRTALLRVLSPGTRRTCAQSELS